MSDSYRPGEGKVTRKELHFIWVLDRSGSMAGQKIQTLNQAIRETVPDMKAAAENNPGAQVIVRALTFSDGASWHTFEPVKIEDFKWDKDITAEGLTDMGKALSMLADELDEKKMPARGLPPVLVLISDGQPTDDFKFGLNKLMNQFWGKKAVRLGISVGHGTDKDVLQKFINHPEIKVLEANSPKELIRLIKWASTGLIDQVTNPKTGSGGINTDDVNKKTSSSGGLPEDDDVW